MGAEGGLEDLAEGIVGRALHEESRGLELGDLDKSTYLLKLQFRELAPEMFGGGLLKVTLALLFPGSVPIPGTLQKLMRPQ